MVLTCSRILQLFLESLGLDITSGIFNRFKNGSNIPFFFFLSKNHRGLIPADTLLIKIVLPIPTNLTFFFEPCSNWILSIFLSKINLRSFSNLLIFTNPRYLPLRNESTRAPSCTIYIINLHHQLLSRPQNNKFQWNRTNDVESRACSFLYTRKNGGCKNPQLI